MKKTQFYFKRLPKDFPLITSPALTTEGGRLIFYSSAIMYPQRYRSQQHLVFLQSERWDVWPLSLGTLSRYPISAPYPGICQRQRVERRSGSVINFNVSWVLRRYFKMSLRERGFCQGAGLVFQKQRRNDWRIPEQWQVWYNNKSERAAEEDRGMTSGGGSGRGGETDRGCK